MRRKKFILFIIGILSILHSISAQERIGLRFDNYQGINTIFFNPANSSTQVLNWNLNLVSAGAFFSNNYAFLENSSVSNLFSKTIVQRPDIGEGNSVDLNEFVVMDYNFKDSKKWAEGTAFVTGPSLLINAGKHHFGAFLNYRAHIAEQNLDEDLGYYTNRRLLIADPVNVDPLQIAGATWKEYGLHYGYDHETSFGKISIGANFRYLNGYEGITLETPDNLSLQRISIDEVEVAQSTLFVNGTTGIINLEDATSSINGNGIGLDIGLAVVVEGNEEDYKFKAGLAINDIGSITFDQNVEGHVFSSTNTTIFNKQNYLELDDLRDLIARASTDILNDPNASLDPSINAFDIKLPMAVTINADYKLADRIFVGGLYVQRIPGGKIGLERSNSFALFTRYESKWLGAALPFSMTNFSKMNIGLSLRLAYLTIGTENLGTLFSQRQLYSGDAYFSLQFFSWNRDGLFNKLFGNGGGKSEKCYDF